MIVMLPNYTNQQCTEAKTIQYREHPRFLKRPPVPKRLARDTQVQQASETCSNHVPPTLESRLFQSHGPV